MKKILEMKFRIMGILALGLLMSLALTGPVQAEDSVSTVEVTGYYRSPISDTIEDSGGEDSYALGQSMVDSMVDPDGLLQQDSDGNWSFYFRFHLMDNISSVSFDVIEADGSEWTAASYAIVGSTDESQDFYVPVPSETSYVRATCYVDAMGRSVIFFVGYDNAVDGNNTDISLYDGSGLTSPDGSTEETEETNTDSESSSETVTPDSEGLIIGYATDSESGDATGDIASSLYDGSWSQGLWIMLFLVVFSGTFCGGFLLLVLVILFKKISDSKKELKAKKLEKYDGYTARRDIEDEIEEWEDHL